VCRKKLLANENFEKWSLEYFFSVIFNECIDNAIIGICRSQQNWDDQ